MHITVQEKLIVSPLLVLAVIGLVLGSMVVMNSDVMAMTSTLLPSSSHATTAPTKDITETGLRAEFDRIAALPYDQYKCREKSDMLSDYIHKHDPQAGVYTVSVPHKSGTYSHVYVVYQGVAFDPTSDPALYRQSMDKYNENLANWGFSNKDVVSQGYNGT